MEVIILGSGSPMPHPDRAGPSTLVRAAGQDFLFDCGRGVLMRAAAVGCGAATIAGQFVTHMHSDHTTDFNDIVTTRWIMSPGPNPLTVYGPVGMKGFADATLAALETDIGYRIAHHKDLNEPPVLDVHELETGPVLDAGGVRISCAPTNHSPVHPTLGFRVEANGLVAAIAGDTVPCEGLDEICRGADIYVQTVIRSDVIRRAKMQRMRDVEDYHSDVRQAAETASRCGVKTLVLNHMVPPPTPDQEADWIAMAAEAFDGEIVVARDLTRIGG
ncbi:MAG: MBL fold metallo-hydrolase [Minwuia sp.]|uniref:MBL fold metallo-hydrolase n=1 Tax=Minwuia sp. TaxID=2493630 RepID=UPI003A8AC817